MKKFISLILIFPLLLSAQDNKQAPQKRWTAIGSVGVVAGETGNNIVFQLANGINYHRFFTGIGIGYDRYHFNSFPVFADWRMNFGKRKSTFIYGLGGYNFPGQHKESLEFSKINDRLRGGAYFDLGLGYRAPAGGSNRLLFSVGYSQKNLERTKIFIYPCVTGNCPETIYHLKYNFRRLTAKLSWELGY